MATLPERILISSCTAGIANRVHVLASNILIAQRLQRKLWLHWPTTPDLICPYFALFKYDVQVIDEHLWLHHVLRTDITFKIYNCNAPYVEEYDADEVILVKSWYRPLTKKSTWASLRAKHLTTVQSILPQDHWVDKAKQLVLPNPTYGCHLRIGDIHRNATELHCKIPYQDSTEEAFIRDMKIILKHEPEAHFYVSTEFRDVFERVCNSFDDGRVIRWPEKTWAHRTEGTGIEEALMELLFLSRCQAVLASENSQYSELASEWGNTPMWIVHKNYPLPPHSWKKHFTPITYPLNWIERMA